jgi:uncharacterized protein involved in exopolysaccharide biosynthesis
VFELLAAILHHRRLMVGLPLIVAATTVLLTLAKDRTYTTAASFAPRSSTTAGALPSIAAQLGVGTATGDPTQQPLFYESLLRSPTILRDAVLTVYRFHDMDNVARTASVLDLYKPSGTTPEMRREQAVDMLRGNMSTFTDGATGTVRFTVKASSPQLSLAIANRLLDLLNTFNLERRRSQATAERDFSRSRLQKSGMDLRDAEESLREFLLRNRVYENDPSLVLEHDRLARTVMLRQTVFTTLAQRLEQGEVDAVRDTPIINVVESPVLPARPDRRYLLFRTVVALVVAAAIAVVLAIMPLLFAKVAASDREAYQRFAAEQEGVLAGLRGRLRAVMERRKA